MTTTAPRLLKKDLFGEVWLSADGKSVDREIAAAAPGLRGIARALARREAAALAVLEGIDGVPSMLAVGRARTRRSYIDGSSLDRVRHADAAYFKAALRLLGRLHRRGVTHNDLAKEPNLLVRPDGSPAFVDFQLAGRFPRRGRLFRLLAYEDLRHLLKHKRSYCAAALTARERRILSAPSLPSRLYRRTVKPVYLFVTRRILGWADREGAADRGARH